MSVFAIVILSTIGALFKVRLHSRRAATTMPSAIKGAAKPTVLTSAQGNSKTVMGSDEDPKDGSAVAGAVFGAVFIYIVRYSVKCTCDLC
jgi:hypothetical protein